MSVYEWRDPWDAIEQVERFERDWYDREDEHRSQMRAAALAFADATYQIRAQAERIMEPVLRSIAVPSMPVINLTAEQAAMLGVQIK